MFGSAGSALEKQVTRAQRRMFVQSLLTNLLFALAAALAISAAWFALQAVWFSPASAVWRLPLVYAWAGLAIVIAIVRTILRAPSRLKIALLIDERFQLKERVITSLALEEGQQKTSAGRALLADVNQRLDKIDIKSQFSMRVSWFAAMGPLCAGLFALASFYYQPTKIEAISLQSDKQPDAPKNAAEIEARLNKLRKKSEKRSPLKPGSEDLKRIEAELDQIANRPRATKEQLRERIKEMTGLETTLKKSERELADRSHALKQQLRQLDRVADQSGNQEGPTKALQKALAEGKLDKAKEEIERLKKSLKNKEMSKSEQEQLAKQLKNVQQKLERLAQQKDQKEQLKNLHAEGKLDADALKRELDQLKQNSQRLQSLQNLANQVGQCQQCLKEGDNEGASESLQAAADQLKQMDLENENLQDIREQLQRLQDAKDSC